MALQLCRIRYKKMKYKCGLLDMIIISVIRLKLRIIRSFRLIKRVIHHQDILLWISVIVLWLLGLYISYKMGIGLGYEKDGFRIYIWNARFSIFTTVIISFYITAYNRLVSYRSNIKKQHFIYKDTMEAFESLFFDYLDGTDFFNYHPLYNKVCLQATLDIIKSSNPEDDCLSIKKCDSEYILQQIWKLQNALENDDLILKDWEAFSSDISWLRRAFNDFNCGNKEYIIFSDVCYYLISIIDQLREIWREDLKDNQKIINLLRKYQENGIENDFYLRMLLLRGLVIRIL